MVKISQFLKGVNLILVLLLIFLTILSTLELKRIYYAGKY